MFLFYLNLNINDFLKKNYPEHFIIIKNLIKNNIFYIKKKIKA